MSLGVPRPDYTAIPRAGSCCPRGPVVEDLHRSGHALLLSGHGEEEGVPLSAVSYLPASCITLSIASGSCRSTCMARGFPVTR